MAEQQKQAQATPVMPDAQMIRHQYGFTGQWLPDVDPIKIGAENFSDIENLRYVDDGIIGVKGYTRINVTTAIATYTKGRAGYQLRTPFTQASIIITHQWDTGLANSKLYTHLATVPNTSDFESSALHTPTGNYYGYFAEFPNGHVVFNNELESLIWAGPEMVVAAVIRHEGATLLSITNPVDFTEEIRNILNDTANVMRLVSPTLHYLVASTRPIKGFRPYISSANGSTSTITVKYWDGNSWESVTNLSDGTSVAGKAHYQTGQVSFDTTVSLAKPAYIDGMLLYFYDVELSAGDCKISHMTVDAPIQAPVDLWDGVYRACIQFQASRSGAYEDWTAEVYDSSSAQYPIGAKVGGIGATDHIIVMCQERATAMKVTMIAGKTNAVAATFTLYYWNGSAWTAVGFSQDVTLDSGGTKTLAQSGYIYWDSPALTSEHPVTLFNTSGYAYKLVPSGTLTDGTSHDGTTIDTLYFIPAPKKMSSFKFGFMYRNRPFWAGDSVGKEGNALHYGMTNSVDVYNGAESAAEGQRVYVGGLDPLTCGSNIYNRFGSNIYDSEVLLKQGETYIFNGDTVTDFKLYCVSKNIGCPAPRTLDTAEIAYEMGRDALRNVALWMSSRGPILFDSGTVVPIKGLNRYFDQNYLECINWTYIDRAHGWFDPNTYGYNLCIPSGTSATDCNVWLVYDLLRKKWYKVNPGAAPIPQATFKVMDSVGRKYIYGLCDNGRMIRLENGDLWDGQYSVQATITTGEFLPTDSIFDTTVMRRVKLIRETQLADISFTDYNFVFNGAGVNETTGNLQVFGEVIEDPTLTSAYFSGDDFYCKELIEGGGTYSEVAGVVTITGVVIEGFVASIDIASGTGDFVAQGFVPWLTITTNDTDCPGPYTITAVSTTSLTLSSTDRFDYKIPRVGPMWVDFVDDDYWTPSIGTWSGSQWASADFGGFQFVGLTPGAWATGYGQTSFKATFSAASLDVVIMGSLSTVTQTVTSGETIDVSSVGTITFVQFGGTASPFTVSAIELYGPYIADDRTIYAQFVRIQHYADGATAYTELAPGAFVGANRFQETNAPCNKLATFHKLKFILYSTATGTNMRPIVWGYQAFVEREDTE